MWDSFVCPKLTDIIVDSENEYYQSIDGHLYRKDGTEFTQYAIGKTDTSYTILDGVTYIAISAFYGSNLVDIVIPDSVTNIDFCAFAYCESLSDVYYCGTEEQWNSISIGIYNDKLLNATIHYNYTTGV